jgi:transposase, IS30 family
LGDWEADTIIGKAHKQAIVSLTERKSVLAPNCKLDRRTKGNTESAIKRFLGSISVQVHTITSDNGKSLLTMSKSQKD